MGADKGRAEQLAIKRRSKLQRTFDCRAKNSERGVGQRICHEHFASGPRVEQLVHAPELWNSGTVLRLLTPGNCSAKTSCNFSLTNLK